MKVSLVIIRLEVESNQIPNDFYYEADEYFNRSKELDVVSSLHDLSLTLQSEHIEIPENFKELPELHKGGREYSDFVIETYKQEMSAEAIAETPQAKSSPLTIQYFSGNPSIETTRGILHLYKDKYLTPLDPDLPRSEMVCMIGVPAKYTCQDVQKYIAPAKTSMGQQSFLSVLFQMLCIISDTIRFIKILRNSVPNQYMVLIKFKNQLNADCFYQEYEGKQYNLLENECSHLVYVSKVESVSTSEGGYLPVSGLTELPTCPVCLERMDESVAGILTVLCNHSFHNECLMKWQDNCCPVCRYYQTPEPEVNQACFECDAKESLWICLICGYVGCGRYQEQHAFQHYQQTAHTFSMHLGEQRVWDYAGDNYVHRLIQSKGDGKLVAVDGSEQMDNKKMDSLTTEYTYLLMNQLESQRLYFEQKIDLIEKDAFEKISLMQENLHETMQDNKIMEHKLTDIEKDKKTLERKYENIITKATTIGKELRDEKQINQCLRDNQVDWQKKVEQLECNFKKFEGEKNAEVVELKSEVTDLMKHLELQAAIGNAEEVVKEDIQSGQVFLEQSPTPKGGARSKTRQKKR